MAWMIVANVAILFMPRDADWGMAIALGAFCAVVNQPCIALWAIAGDRMRRWLGDPGALRRFNRTMATLLAGTSGWIAFDEVVMV